MKMNGDYVIAFVVLQIHSERKCFDKIVLPNFLAGIFLLGHLIYINHLLFFFEIGRCLNLQCQMSAMELCSVTDCKVMAK